MTYPRVQIAYFDDSGLPKPFNISSFPDLALRTTLVKALSIARHSCGHATLPGLGLLIRTLAYHDPSEILSGAPVDDSDFLATLVEVCFCPRCAFARVVLLPALCFCPRCAFARVVLLLALCFCPRCAFAHVVTWALVVMRSAPCAAARRLWVFICLALCLGRVSSGFFL